MGDYHEVYKASPEAQRLIGWAPAQSSQNMQQAGSRQAAHQHSSQAAKGMHAFMRQAEDGTSVVVLDVSFPHSLSEGLEEIDSTIQPYSWSNATAAAVTSLIVKPQPKFHPANAALADWQAPLDVVCHSHCMLAASGPGSITVTSPAESLEVLPYLEASAPACMGQKVQHLHTCDDYSSLLRPHMNKHHCTLTLLVATEQTT